MGRCSLLVQGQWPCRFCGKVYWRSEHLSHHETHHHGALLPYPCTHCRRGFVAYAALVRHSLTAHGVEVRYSLSASHFNFSLILVV